uniref:Uncharacterized protein n=1 Tax=Halorubrum distributum TaxID=29283 RepID=A0A2R2NVP4_9EURY|nr:hypothetical protein [Halorubrum litoreum]AKB09797.1 hypothetical protein [Halorubrum litoreum]
MVTFQFEIEDDKWESWKDTVPRSKNLDTRIVELIEADTEDSRKIQHPRPESSPSDPQGRRAEDTAPESHAASEGRAAQQNVEQTLRELNLPGRGDDLEARIGALVSMYELLEDREGDRVEADELQSVVEDFDHGYASTESFWSNCVKKNAAQDRPNALTALSGVREAGTGKYTYEGEKA